MKCEKNKFDGVFKVLAEANLTKMLPENLEVAKMEMLIADVVKWRNIGDKVIEEKIWGIISTRAEMYSDGMRESSDKAKITN